MDEEDKQDAINIHVLIQERHYDFYGFIREHGEEIDNHVEVCEECHHRMIGWTSSLPKLRARMTVQFPSATSDGGRLTQMRQLKPGQCLPCGCEVLDVAWTLEQARAKFYKALAEIMQVSENDARKVPDEFRLQDLPLGTKSLRRLRDKFWFPDMSSGSEEIRDAEEGDKVLQLPETVGDFITNILTLHSGMSYKDCSEHWDP